ncbi:DOD-type homing endonuclease [Aeromonas phage AerS_266]|nr:DOD-type homing endonuclease [Aeromonas phage AerS_266]
MRTTLTVYKASTYVRLTDFKPELVRQVLRPFCKRNFFRFQKVPGELFGTSKWEVKQVYARFNHNETELRFNPSKLEELLRIMESSGYKRSRIRIEDEEKIQAKKVDISFLNDKIKPRNETQEEYCDFMGGPLPLVVNNMTTGGGKAQPLHSKIKIPGGWSTMGEMKVGDYVTAWDGTSSKVIGVFPQGKKDIYRITFYDGRSTEVCAEHLWKVYDCSKRKHKRWEIIDTSEIIRRFELAQPRIYVPLPAAEITEDKDFKLDPWALGALLGDGGFTGTVVTFTNNDPFVVNKLSERLGEDFSVKTRHTAKAYENFITMNQSKVSLLSVLKSIGIEQAVSLKKSIPEEYMNGSIEQRWELLRGLMDTDGSADLCGSRNENVGHPVFSTSSEKLALQVQELVWSLGGIAKITSRIPKYEHKGEKLKGQLAYRVYIRIKNPKRCFSLPKKKDRVPQETQYSEKLKLRITNVELVSHEEAQCISIDHPDHLYVTDDYIVTHNTFCALYTAKLLADRILITVLPRYIDIWIKAMGEFYNIKPQDILVADILNVQQVHENVKSGVSDPKVIILPLSKIDIYLKKCKEEPTLPTLDQIYSDLGIGTRIIDEAHESIYSVYNSLMYGNVNKTIILSATLKGDDEFINGIYSQIFPHTSYLKPPEYTQYIRVISYFHRMKLWEYRINTKGFGGYSHVKFEQGILKRPDVFERYYQMLKGAYDMFYMDEYREGQKSMWFFATIEFCERFNKRLLKDYPELDSIVFNSVTNKKNPTAYREHRNVVTTPGSCGTGKDIKKLYAVFSPIAVSSSQRNDQMVGRTRPIDEWWPDLDPIFVYFVCVDEPKQVEYGRKRKGIFTKKMKIFEPIDSGVTV